MAKDNGERRNVTVGTVLFGLLAGVSITWRWLDGVLCLVLAGGVLVFVLFHVVAWFIGEAVISHEARLSRKNIGKRPAKEKQP